MVKYCTKNNKSNRRIAIKNFDLSPVGNSAKFPEGKLESLQFYLQLAEVTIKTHGNKYSSVLSKSEDAINFISNSLILADLKWKPNKRMTLKSWRISQGIFAISKYVKRLRRINKNSINTNEYYGAIDHHTPIDSLLDQEQQDVVLYSLNNSGLKPMESEVIKMRLWDNLTFKQIAEHYKITKQAAQMRYGKAIKKLDNIWNTKTNQN